MPEKEVEILILDDESTIKENLELFLEDENYKVFSVESAEKALDLLNSGKSFALGIIDIRLPGMNGINFIKEARKIDSAMKFIIHTGSLNFQLDEQLIEIGLTKEDVFKKPVLKINALIKRIKEVI